MPEHIKLSALMIRHTGKMIAEGRGSTLPSDVRTAYIAQTGNAVPALKAPQPVLVVSPPDDLAAVTVGSQPERPLEKPLLTPIFVSARLDDLRLSASTFRVYANLARRANKGTGCSFPSRSNIAQVCRLHRDTVDTCLSELLVRGLIAKERKPGFVSNYRITKLHEWVKVTGNEGLALGFSLPETEGQVVAESKVLPLSETKGHKGNPVRKSIEGDPINGADAPPLILADLYARLPDLLNTEAFRAAWNDWLAYRREAKMKVLRPASILAQWRSMAAWGHDLSITAINNSIRQGWQGLFEPKALAVSVNSSRHKPIDYLNGAGWGEENPAIFSNTKTLQP